MEFDLTTLVGSIGVPGALCFVVLRQYSGLQKSIDNNTRALYLLASKIGAPLGEDDQIGK